MGAGLGGKAHVTRCGAPPNAPCPQGAAATGIQGGPSWGGRGIHTEQGLAGTCPGPWGLCRQTEPM